MAVWLMLLTTCKTKLNASCNSYGSSRFRKMMHSAVVIRFISFYKSLDLRRWVQFLESCFNTTICCWRSAVSCQRTRIQAHL